MIVRRLCLAAMLCASCAGAEEVAAVCGSSDVMRWDTRGLCGVAPTGVTAQATLLPSGADRSGVAVMHYPDKQVILTYSKIGQGTAPSEIIGDGGSITVGSVSRMADISLHLNGQPERVLAEADDKPVQMGREIASFARSLEAGERMGGEKERLALSVSRWMKKIRDVAGIRFPQGDEQ